MRPLRGRLLVLGAALVVAFLLSLAVGPAAIGLRELLRGLFDPQASGADTIRTLVLDLRLPRAVLAVLAGAGLAVGGVLLQAFFQNPMAGPYVVGVSSGAGLAVSIVAVLAGTAAPPQGSVPAAALLGGMGIVALVASLAERVRARRTETLLLLGLAIAAICSAITSVLMLTLPRGPEGVLFWLMGSLAGANWNSVILVAVALCVGLGVGVWNARGLDAILWGDETAQSVGVDVRRTRRAMLVASTIPVAASVAACGVIGFLGLMVPHIARGLVGAGHGRLLPTSAIIGATWLLVADGLARMLLSPAELPVGAITSAVGAPFLVWICLRRRGTWGSSGSTQKRS
jgi:iron complex transport system permease protein